MPKEIIEYGRDFIIRDNTVIHDPVVVMSNDEKHRSEEITLNWTKGESGAVQLGIEVDLTQLAEIVRLAEAGEWLGETPPGRIALYSPALGRGALQRLLKHGKRARNDVFGEDE